MPSREKIPIKGLNPGFGTLAMLFSLTVALWVALWVAFGVAALAHVDEQVYMTRDTYDAVFPSEWEVLGPFPAGMREQNYGADPLEAYGGFHSLTYDEHDRYSSEFGPNGTIGWRRVYMTNDHYATVEYPEIDWAFVTEPSGWPAIQHQTWARATLSISRPTVLVIQAYPVAMFSIDDKRYSGDVYSYNTTRHVVRLSPGPHTISVRMVHETRIFGAKIPPRPGFGFWWEAMADDGSDIVRILPSGTIIPNIVNGQLGGPLGRVTVLNTGKKDIWVQRVLVRTDEISGGVHVNVELSAGPVEIVAGQQRPLKLSLSISSSRVVDQLEHSKVNVPIDIIYIVKPTMDNPGFPIQRYLKTNLTFKFALPGKAYKITFADYDQSVQYAMLKSPKVDCIKQQCHAPILALHGAGVEADSEFWTEEIPQQELSWVVFPTGRTSWGYDWHGASYLNVLKALSQVTHSEQSPFLLVGHSNGGQGAWHVLTHQPDRIMAAIPASGYTSIHNYVPYSHHQSRHYTDPILRGLLESSIAEYDLDVHIGNAKGISVLGRTGSRDDNVPPWHTKSMIRLLNQHTKRHQYKVSEVEGQGHWFSGVLGSSDMMQFLQDEHKAFLDNGGLFPEKFTITCINPGGMGSKGGILIEQLEQPFRLSTIDVMRLDEQKDGSLAWQLNTQNIRRFTILMDQQTAARRGPVTHLIIDGIRFPDTLKMGSNALEFVKISGRWERSHDKTWKYNERTATTYGPAIRIYESRDPLQILLPDNGDVDEAYHRIALEIAADWYMYGGGDAVILPAYRADSKSKGNVITLGHQGINSATRALARLAGDVEITSEHIKVNNKRYHGPGIGIVSLHPWDDDRLALIIAGTDRDGIDIAAQVIPKRTGMLVPDYGTYPSHAYVD
ncbi:hypothetical protein BZG36_02819 [Bifiguratus adelaidae]|uniref:Peptidase S9 prolyl oligopeptidase catalytic domain-containing protein n=1 Tax=Bifiguratus adelaidae TaxID=1938954 RepID=A0A261Y0H9_9FUNG|nr:hypothetical protein BZG36_02819 [Bifiguratus adelaidae]